MKDIMTAPFLVKTVRTITEMYRHGWDERNGGNVSLLLDEVEVKDYVDITKVLRTISHRVRSAGAGRKVFPGHEHGQLFQERTVRAGEGSGTAASGRRRQNGGAAVGIRGRRKVYQRICRAHPQP